MTRDEPVKSENAAAADRARKRRSVWMTLSLVAFVILVFAITIAKLGAGVLVRDI